MAEVANQIIDQYASWSFAMVYSDTNSIPINLTGWSAALMIRDVYGGSVLLSLTSPSGGIVLGTTDGTITVKVDAATTGGFTWTSGVYDLVLTDTFSNVYRMVEGTVTVNPGVTH